MYGYDVGISHTKDQALERSALEYKNKTALQYQCKLFGCGVI